MTDVPAASADHLLNETILRVAGCLPGDNRVSLAALAYALAGAAVALDLPESALVEMVRIALAETKEQDRNDGTETPAVPR